MIKRLAATAAVLIAVVVAALTPTTAASGQVPGLLPDCPGNTAPRVVLSGGGALENVIADPQGGRLFLTDLAGGRVLVLDEPGGEPRTLAPLHLPAGLAWTPEGKLIVGYNQFFGQSGGPPGLVLMDPDTGATEPLAENLNGANGLAVAADGTVYTSGGSFGGPIDRIRPDGTVTRAWADLPWANGLQLDPSGRTLYGTRVFGGVGIQSVDVDRPNEVREHFAAPPLASTPLSAIDGMQVDARGRLYAAVYLSGAVWRIAADGQSACALARDPRFVPNAMVGLGSGGDFPATSAYVVTHTGYVFELPNAVR